jgi:hypothetical protein
VLCLRRNSHGLKGAGEIDIDNMPGHIEVSWAVAPRILSGCVLPAQLTSLCSKPNFQGGRLIAACVLV